MENNQTIKMGFWKRIKFSIFNVENYDIFAVEKFSKALGYFIKLIIVFSLLVAIGLTYQFSKVYTKTTESLKNEVPDFQYAEGKLILNAEGPITIENENSILSKIIIDDTEDIEKQKEYREEIKKYPTAFLFLKDGVCINLPNQEEPVYYNYQGIMQQFGIQEFTKQQMVDYINQINLEALYGAFYITAVIYLFQLYLIFTFSDVILLSVLGFFTSRMARMKLRYMPIINISIYALTLSVLLNAIYMIVNILTGFEIQYFQVMYNAVAYIYVVTAILMIRAEMIKQQIELVKLAEEQKKVKEELEQEKKEKEEKQKEKKKDKPEEEDKKEEDNGVADENGVG